MKKYFLLLTAILLVSGCDKEKVNVPLEDDNKEEIVEQVPVYKDDNPIVVGLYRGGKLVDEYITKFNYGEDIVSFDVYFTNESDVGGSNTKANFNKYYNTYQNIDKYKIGFYLSFETVDEKREVVLLDPSKMYDLRAIFTYLYDDIHQADGAWYDHVEVSDVKDDTLYTSIKLYAGGDTSVITSPITLMVFTYDDMDDFDENGLYRGNSSYTITIKNS